MFHWEEKDKIQTLSKILPDCEFIRSELCFHGYKMLVKIFYILKYGRFVCKEKTNSQCLLVAKNVIIKQTLIK